MTTCSECGAEIHSPHWGRMVFRDCVQAEYERTERATMPATAAGNDTHALPSSSQAMREWTDSLRPYGISTH